MITCNLFIRAEYNTSGLAALRSSMYSLSSQSDGCEDNSSKYIKLLNEEVGWYDMAGKQIQRNQNYEKPI